MADPWKPRYLVLHDYGGSPKNRDGVFNPYNALVFPDGSVRYRKPDDPYGVRAPHAYRLNPSSVGLSYAGEVGSTPTPAALEALRREFQAVQKRFPGIIPLGHGEAYQQTRGTPMQASKHGRDLREASWRTSLYGAAAPSVVASPPAPSAPVPMAQRGLTTHAGLSQPTNILAGSRYDDGSPDGAIGTSSPPTTLNAGTANQPTSPPAPESRMALGGPPASPMQSGPPLPSRNPIRGAAAPLSTGYRPATWENVNGTMTPKFQPSPVAGAAGGMIGAPGRKKFMGWF